MWKLYVLCTLCGLEYDGKRMIADVTMKSVAGLMDRLEKERKQTCVLHNDSPSL
jgi:hypothetical protein